LRCFHSKVSFSEDILGIPINVKFGSANRVGERFITEISSPLDLLSRGAFYEEKIRKSV